MTTILCIEDEEAIRQDIVEELEDAGYATLEACNGESGLASIRAHNPDLVLCDINMPKVDGYTLVKHLRESFPQYSELPFIFLSALGDRKDILAGLELGADDYLTKPIDFEFLLIKVEATLRWVARMRRQKEREQIKLFKNLAKDGAGAQTHPRPEAPRREAPAQTAHKPTAFEEKTKEILSRRATGSAGRLHFINLSEIKDTMGDDWERLSGKAMTIAESVIKRHLTNSAVCKRHQTDAFLLLLPDLREEEAVVLVETIADEIATKILGENYRDFRHLSLTATAKSMNGVDGGDGHLTETALAAALEKHAVNADGTSGRAVDVISRMLQRVCIGFQPVWSPQNERVLAFQACPHIPPFDGGYGDEGATTDTVESPVAVDIDLHLISWLLAHPPICGTDGVRARTILPIHYQTLVGDNRERVVDAFETIAKSGLSKLVMVEIVAIPEDADFASVEQAVSLPKAYSHPVIVRGSPHQKFATWARKAEAAFLSFNFGTVNAKNNHQGNDHRMRSFAAGAIALGFKPYIHGLNTLGGVKEAIAVEVPMLAGTSIGPELDRPGEPHHLRKERILIR
jgi:DNA-binding response OmpR family regulator